MKFHKADDWPYRGHEDQGRKDARRGRKDYDLYDPYDGERKVAYSHAYDEERRKMDRERREEEERQEAAHRARREAEDRRREEWLEEERQQDEERRRQGDQSAPDGWLDEEPKLDDAEETS